MAIGIFHSEEATITPVSASSLVGEHAVDWADEAYEGQLAVDVYQTEDTITIRSTIAGVQAEDLEIILNNDVVTIRGQRRQEIEIPKEAYLYQECYWGGFSRSIVLPVEVKADEVQASLKNGVLTVVMPKAQKRPSEVAVRVRPVEE